MRQPNSPLKILYDVCYSNKFIGLDKKKEIKIPAIYETLVEPKEDDVLELDELWSYVGNKKHGFT